ncbi:hypothetical protein [uncultured Salinicola sp.]|uniref:hypothetical protein n=1 Tax=uncultured Salinicola sp. TaxID=1193542 RepID=UPI00263335E2|nr:hypothetical protein [uncultured Salinicola sp.]|tara:strand:+ start:529 stop:1209 length:681 start_codon:yes stop_codon:yes gene_type:complete
MSEVWCRTECQPDSELPCIQHIVITAHADAGEAEACLGGNALRAFHEDRDGLRLGRMVMLRYASPKFTLDGMDGDDLDTVSQVDEEGREIVGAMIRADAVTGSRPSCGLIMGKSIHVVPSVRGQRVMTRLLQEARRLHAGIPFHYAHRAIPQEGSCYQPGYEARMERLRDGYLAAGVDLTVPDPDSWPEIMTAYWDGLSSAVDECVIDWTRTMPMITDRLTLDRAA